MKPAGINVSILGKELTVACPPEERPALYAAAAYLDTKMRGVQETGKVIGVERCAIVAGLNIANELLQAQRPDSGWMSEMNRRLQVLRTKIDRVLQEE